MRAQALIPLSLIMALSACGGESAGPVKSASVAISRPRAVVPPMRPATVRPPLPKPQRLMMPGLEGVVGSTGSQLVSQFGTARLDVLEGDARKLQFTGSACVLDIYLYPSTAGAEPQATYVDARRPSDGQDVDRAACVAALRKR
ncbi:MAG: hypothetical protein ABIQ66_10975 [Novosphingobium sp.]